jgi:acyl-CoA dehydrogenase
MTEFGVASSDATNLRGTIRKEGDEVVVNCHKWWISGAGDPRNAIHILIGLSDPTNPSPHQRHTIVLIPPNTPGVTIVRPMMVMGYDDAPEGHCEVRYDNVRLKESDCLVGGWGRGFEIIQGRLGPGRIHHCMRSIGTASRALDMMLERVSTRKTFGKYLREHGTILADIAKSRAEIDSARLLVLSAAHQIDEVRAKGAMKDIGIAKFTVPAMALQVLDRAMQSFGAEGISQDQPLPKLWSGIRTLRYADGPDEVHLQQIGKQELKRLPLVEARTANVSKRSKALLASAARESKL